MMGDTRSNLELKMNAIGQIPELALGVLLTYPAYTYERALSCWQTAAEKPCVGSTQPSQY